MARILAELPYTDIASALASGAPVIGVLPVGATEAHGPHLPLMTDVTISEGIARRVAELLDRAHDCHPFVLPALAYTPAEYAREFPGTISIRPETHAAVLEDLAHSLHVQGFACLAIANSHFDPANVGVLRSAAKRIAAAGLPVAFADATRRELAAQLTDEFKSGDCHGGQFESSIVLAERPDLVRAKAMQALPPRPVGLIDAVSSGKEHTFKSIGMDRAYCGDPKAATADEGQRSLDVLARALAAAVRAALGRA